MFTLSYTIGFNERPGLGVSLPWDAFTILSYLSNQHLLVHITQYSYGLHTNISAPFSTWLVCWCYSPPHCLHKWLYVKQSLFLNVNLKTLHCLHAFIYLFISLCLKFVFVCLWWIYFPRFGICFASICS